MRTALLTLLIIYTNTKWLLCSLIRKQVYTNTRWVHVTTCWDIWYQLVLVLCCVHVPNLKKEKGLLKWAHFIGLPWQSSVTNSQGTNRFQWKSTVLCISCISLKSTFEFHQVSLSKDQLSPMCTTGSDSQNSTWASMSAGVRSTLASKPKCRVTQSPK